MAAPQKKEEIVFAPAVADLAKKAAAAIYDEKSLRNRSLHKRISSGIYLLALQKMITQKPSLAGGMRFWDFFEYVGFGISRKEAEKRIADAKSDNPEAANEARKQADAEAQSRKRAKTATAADVSGKQAADTQSDYDDEPEEEEHIQPNSRSASKEVASMLVEQAWAIVKRMNRNEKLELLERLEGVLNR